MKPTKTRLGLSILAGGLSFVGAANATDLIVNGSFENPNGGEWKYYKTYNHSTMYFGGVPIPESENPGLNFSWQHASADGAWDNFVTPTNEVDHLAYNLQWADSQTVSLTTAVTPAAIDNGLGRYTFSSWLASYGNPNSNPEQPYLVLRFFDDSVTTQVGTDIIFDRTKNVHAVTFADGTTTIPDDVSFDHSWIKYVATGTVPSGARKATVYITRSPYAEKSFSPDTYVDLLKLDVINVNDTTALDSADPSDNKVNVSPDATVTVTLRDINSQVNQSTVKLTFDGSPVTPDVQKAGAITTVKYDPPGLLAPFVAHTYQVVWSDTGTPVITRTNQISFTVAPYQNLNLGTPIYLETFDSVAEGALPAGWAVSNQTDQDVPGMDLNDFHSDSYLDWVVISRSTLSNLFVAPNGGGDFPSTLNVRPNQVINNALVTNLIDGNFIFAVSDRATGQKQIQYLFSRDFNLSGKANIYLAFNSIWTQNQDSLGSVEYSINGGATWLPALYMVDRVDLVTDASGTLGGSNTMAFIHGDVPNLELQTLTDGNYGQFIGVKSNQWASIAPFLSGRIDDDQFESKRVEILRLPQADNQSTVRLRFANIGTWSWYWGIDNVGFYSIPQADLPVLASAPTPAVTTAIAGNSVTLTIGDTIGLGPMTYQWRHNGVNIPGKTGQILAFPVVRPEDAGTYDVVVSNPGGSATSAPPAAVLNVINQTVYVTGQWDFNGSLAATVGANLEYFDSTVQADTTFGTTTSFGIADINGQPTPVMHFLPSTASWGGYKMTHGGTPNGGGDYVNQYTVVLDVYYPAQADMTWRSLWQTASDNANDADLFINTGGGLGVSSVYEGKITPDAWHRIAFAFDLAAPALVKFIDGVKVGNQTTGLSAVDGRFSLDPVALLFADNDGDVNEVYVSSVQFSNGRRPDSYLAALGGPSAKKIAGALKVVVNNQKPVISWTGGTPLESADQVTGPWSVVTGATSPYTPPATDAAKFYRPKLQ